MNAELKLTAWKTELWKYPDDVQKQQGILLQNIMRLDRDMFPEKLYT